MVPRKLQKPRMATSCKPVVPIASWLDNLNTLNAAGDIIKSDGDVRNRDVAYAVLSAPAAAAG